MGFEVPDAPTLGTLMSTWRLNLLFAVLAVAGIAFYLAMVIALRRRGTSWPISRVLLWCGGLAGRPRRPRRPGSSTPRPGLRRAHGGAYEPVHAFAPILPGQRR